MGSTNKTTSLSLPQWIGTDKPTFLGDMNDAFLKIDEGYTDLSGKISTATSESGQAIDLAKTANDNASKAVSSLETVSTKADNAYTKAETANTTAVNANSTANTAKQSVTQLDAKIKNTVSGSYTNKVSTINTWYGGFCSYNEELQQLFISFKLQFNAKAVYSQTNIAKITGLSLPNSTTRQIFGALSVLRTSGNYEYTPDFLDLYIEPSGQLYTKYNDTSLYLHMINCQVCLDTSHWS